MGVQDNTIQERERFEKRALELYSLFGEKAQTFCRRQRAQAFIRLVACMALRDCWAQHCILGAVFGLSSDE